LRSQAIASNETLSTASADMFSTRK
jgi:hypothetical protein